MAQGAPYFCLESENLSKPSDRVYFVLYGQWLWGHPSHGPRVWIPKGIGLQRRQLQDLPRRHPRSARWGQRCGPLRLSQIPTSSSTLPRSTNLRPILQGWWLGTETQTEQRAATSSLPHGKDRSSSLKCSDPALTSSPTRREKSTLMPGT